MNNEKRIVIVGTVPYNPNSQSRLYESFFSGFDRQNLAQVFSNTKTPVKGHCERLYQITDQRMLKRRFKKSVITGKRFLYDDLPERWADNKAEVSGGVFRSLYKLSGFKSPLTHLLRKIVWKKKYWCTKDFNNWLEEFDPECVFLSFSDDFFIGEIALYIADKFNIPIVAFSGDDYYFNAHFSLSPFYLIYKSMHRRHIRKIFSRCKYASLSSDFIKDKYAEHFGINTMATYLSSAVKRREFREIRKKDPLITYCGNIRIGRNLSLIDVANALKQVCPEYKLHIYSNEDDEKYYKPFEAVDNIVFHGVVPYSEVQKIIADTDIFVVVEGFRKKDIDVARYSISTKISDALASGDAVLAYGSYECTAIKYMDASGAAVVCGDSGALPDKIRLLIENTELQKEMYDKAAEVFENNHNSAKNVERFKEFVRLACGENK
ncbi:MAG: glycosyltransferase family 4 protein [Clostridia bacterium]|nr:glycosyltransferase family 4 protein [Clostridia bacterium]MBR4910191.1 glycosyltransferase family 4 protein [Clostridia bacterium]